MNTDLEHSVEITDEMVRAALKALEPYKWEDGMISPSDHRKAIADSLRAALRVQPQDERLASTSAST